MESQCQVSPGKDEILPLALTTCAPSLLPKPKHETHYQIRPAEDGRLQKVSVAAAQTPPPPYGQRSGFVPRGAADYNDGGAYPEIHIAQYPLEMGRKRQRGLVARTLPVRLDADGQTQYDLIARAGHAEDRLVQTRLSDMQPKVVAEDELARPDAEQVTRETEEAKRAIQALVLQKTAKTQPKSFSASAGGEVQMIKYTPTAGGNLAKDHNSGAQSRLIQMVQMPVDPLQPPKFHHKRIPRPPPSPPAPRLHSPPRKVSAEEQRAWHVPPCISSWKNPKGYTVPLDKRLASDGKSLQEKTINPRMSDLAEALFLAEKHNREEVEMRAAVERKVAEQEKRKKDEQLRMLAEKARLDARNMAEDLERAARHEDRMLQESYRGHAEDISNSGLGLTIRERERLRQDRAYERERELRLSRMSAEQRAKVLAREQDRDVSEKIALGVAQPTAAREALFDQRLFDQSQGIASGYGGDDDNYNLYDKPLFGTSAAHLIYRPQIGRDGDNGGEDGEGSGDAGAQSRRHARPDKAFSGTDAAQGKEGPVQFERVDDPFGVDQFLAEAKKGKRGADARAENDPPGKQRRGDSRRA